jgi:hypothetical protein
MVGAAKYAALVRSAEEALLDELFEQLLACGDMHVP